MSKIADEAGAGLAGFLAASNRILQEDTLPEGLALIGLTN